MAVTPAMLESFTAALKSMMNEKRTSVNHNGARGTKKGGGREAGHTHA